MPAESDSADWGCLIFMVFVKARRGESSDSLIRKFTRKALEEGIVQQIRDRQFFKPPSEIRKEMAKRRKAMRKGGGMRRMFGGRR